MKILNAIIFIVFGFTSITIYSEEFDYEKNAKLFTQMFGTEYSKVKNSSTKKDDEKYALELLENATALQSKPGLQTYIKIQAAYLFQNTLKYKKKARDLFTEISSDLPTAEKNKIKKDLLVLQKNILKKTSRKKKNEYVVEVEIYVSFSQNVANQFIKENNYTESIKVLRDALRYLKMVDKDAANQLNKQIKSIQQDARRFNQINTSIKLLNNKPSDFKANLTLANYYLLEKSNLYKAWPYLERSGDEALVSFMKNIKQCMDDQSLKTTDGVSMSYFPLINEHPTFLLQWLSSKDLEDPGNIISSQLKLAEANKDIKANKVKLVISNTVKMKGKESNVSHEVYLNLAKDFDILASKVKEQKNIQKNAAKYMTDQLLSNQFIALSKAKLKLAKNKTADELVKLKLDMEIGKCSKKIEKEEIETFDVTLQTPFLFQKSDLLNNSIDVSGGSTYTFDANNWRKFNKDFEIIVNRQPYNPKDESDIYVKKGQLCFASKSGIMFKAKKKKWNSNIEVSFDLIKKRTQTIDIMILLAPDNVGYKRTFCVYYHAYMSGGWYGVMKYGEEIHDFFRSKLTHSIRSEQGRNKLLETGQVRIAAVFKKKNFEIYLNDVLVKSSPIEALSNIKGFPNTPIQFHILRKYGKLNNEIPIKMDNLYIGPPKRIKPKRNKPKKKKKR